GAGSSLVPSALHIDRQAHFLHRVLPSKSPPLTSTFAILSKSFFGGLQIDTFGCRFRTNLRKLPEVGAPSRQFRLRRHMPTNQFGENCGHRAVIFFGLVLKSLVEFVVEIVYV